MKRVYCFSILSILLVACQSRFPSSSQTHEPVTEPPLVQLSHGAIVRGDTTQKRLALVFTGHQFADGGDHIQAVLRKRKVSASFFFTGQFYQNPGFSALIQRLIQDGHYLGAHSDQHLLYCDWEKRDSLLVTKAEFLADLRGNYERMSGFGIKPSAAPFFLPPYEWYNDTISAWTQEAGFRLVNMTYGTRSHADYTTPEMPNYITSRQIYQSILDYETTHKTGLNGFILLIHIGTDPARKDKFYLYLDELIDTFYGKGYELVRIDELIEEINSN